MNKKMVVVILASIIVATLVANALTGPLSKIPVPPPDPEIPIEWGGTSADPRIPGVDWDLYQGSSTKARKDG